MVARAMARGQFLVRELATFAHGGLSVGLGLDGIVTEMQ
jgi:hypothetical protein